MMANRMASAMANRMAKPVRFGWQNYAPNPNPNPNPVPAQLAFACSPVDSTFKFKLQSVTREGFESDE